MVIDVCRDSLITDHFSDNDKCRSCCCELVAGCVDECVSAETLSLILDLLTFCVERHTYHSKNYVMNRNVGHHVLALLKSRHAFISLGLTPCVSVCLSLSLSLSLCVCLVA